MADFSLRFWGVRGSIACSGPRTVRYGGNTSCIEVRCGERLLIFDGGTGLRYLGNTLKQIRSTPTFSSPTRTSTTSAGCPSSARSSSRRTAGGCGPGTSPRA